MGRTEKLADRETDRWIAELHNARYTFRDGVKVKVNVDLYSALS